MISYYDECLGIDLIEGKLKKYALKGLVTLYENPCSVRTWLRTEIAKFIKRLADDEYLTATELKEVRNWLVKYANAILADWGNDDYYFERLLF